MATNGKNVAAAIFWMKARAGWREKHAAEVAGPYGQPLLPPVVVIRKFFAPVDDQRLKVSNGWLVTDLADEPEQ